MCSQQKDLGFRGNAHEFKGGFGDDSQDAFAADEELAQVNACVVFFQGVVELQNRTVGENDFHAQHPLARQPIADDAHAADIGGEVAADLAGAFGGQVNGPEEAVLGAMLMHRFCWDAGFHFQRLSKHVDGAQGAHFFEGQNGFALGCDSAAGKPCAAPGRDDGDGKARTQGHIARNFFCCPRKNDEGSLGGESGCPVHAVALQKRFFGTEKVFGEFCFKGIPKFRGEGHSLSLTCCRR